MPRLTDDARKRIVELYLAPMSGTRVSDEVGYSLPTVMKVVREAGVERNFGPHSARRPGKGATFTRVKRASGKGGWVWKATYNNRKITLSEARVMASKKLGRDLRDDEYVHFKDGDPYNTDEDNLYVDTNMRPKYGDATRVCSRCDQEKSWPSEFPKAGGKVCLDCANRRARLNKIARKYGLSREQVEAMPTECAICGAPCPSGRRLAIDHDHETGVVRGFLCVRHNMGLGYFQDSVEQLQAAIDYLLGHAADVEEAQAAVALA